MNAEPRASRVVDVMVGRFTLRVHAPCSESWHDMAGDARQRFCTRCALPVHDLSAMNDADALKLLTAPDERVCVRYGVRADGTVVTGGRCASISRLLRAALVAAVSAAFWTVVVLVQRPWQALTRSSAPPAPASAPSQTDAEQARLEDLLRSIQADNAHAHKHMGARSSGERDRLRAEHAQKK